MSEHLYIDTADRKRILTRWVVITLYSLHAWASFLVLSAVFSKEPSQILATMFSTVCFGIGATILILSFDKAADVLLARFTLPAAPPPAEVKETLTRTVTTSAAEGDKNV